MDNAHRDVTSSNLRERGVRIGGQKDAAPFVDYHPGLGPWYLPTLCSPLFASQPAWVRGGEESKDQTAAVMDEADEAAESSKRLLDCPEEILVLVASALTATPKSLLAFGSAARSLEALLLHGDEAAVLWDAASARHVRHPPPPPSTLPAPP